MSKYGTDGITEVNFKCRLCKTSMSCNGVTIASHLLNNHKLTITEYEKSYLPVPGEEQKEDQEEETLVQPEPDHFLFAKSSSPASNYRNLVTLASQFMLK